MSGQKAHIGEKEYVLVILKEEKGVDECGRPKNVVVGYDDTKFNLEGGERFWTAWVPVEMAKKLHLPPPKPVEKKQ